MSAGDDRGWCAPTVPDRDAEQRLDSSDDDLAAMEQNLANARSAGKQEGHVEVDERRRPVDSRDRPKARSRLRARDRLDVLLDEVEDQLRARQRQPDRRKSRYW
jgi:hypothetical protein